MSIHTTEFETKAKAPDTGDAARKTRESRAPSFAETALRLGGKSEEEARRTGAVDAADDQIEALFALEYQTVNSPVHRAVWGRRVPIELFGGSAPTASPAVDKVFQDSLDVVRQVYLCQHPIYPGVGQNDRRDDLVYLLVGYVT